MKVGLFPMLVDLIEGGFIAQTILVLLVWGAIVLLAVEQKALPDALLDAGFVIIGFYFRSVIGKTNGQNTPQPSVSVPNTFDNKKEG